MTTLKAIQAWYWFDNETNHSLGEWFRQLSLSDQKLADELSHPEMRKRFIMSRKMRNECLKKWVPAVETEKNPWGKPQLKPHTNPHQIHFNISHTTGCILLAIGPTELGVDAENTLRTVAFKSLTRKHFHPEEQDLLRNEQTPQRFIQFWTCKEALAKALGVGVYRSFHNTIVHDQPHPHIIQPEGWNISQANINNYWLTVVHQQQTPFSGFHPFTPNTS